MHSRSVLLSFPAMAHPATLTPGTAPWFSLGFADTGPADGWRDAAVSALVPVARRPKSEYSQGR